MNPDRKNQLLKLLYNYIYDAIPDNDIANNQDFYKRLVMTNEFGITVNETDEILKTKVQKIPENKKHTLDDIALISNTVYPEKEN